MLTTVGQLLDGRLTYTQHAEGFRTGIEPVLLAAAIPARAGEQVLEAGTGAGAALLCLHARVPGIRSLGIEVDPATATLAARNAEANGFADMRIVSGAIETAPLPERFDHALANPPYHPPDGTPSSTTERERAKRGSADLIQVWVRRLGDPLRERGSLTLIVPVGLVPTCLAAMTAAHCPCSALFPLWPMLGRPAKLVLLRGMKNARTPMRLLAGLVLHEPDGRFTADADAVLREGAALQLG